MLVLAPPLLVLRLRPVVGDVPGHQQRVDHPPAALHHPLPDACRSADPGRLAGLPERRPEIAGLVTGHAHTGAASVFAGRPPVVGPGVTWTVRLPWEGEGAGDRDAPVGPSFHVLDHAGRLTAHFRGVT